MTIVETPWERRNLGVKSSAVLDFKRDDTPSDIDFSRLSSFSYLEARVPVNKMDLVQTLTDAGFRFSEVQFNLAADLNELESENPFSKYADAFSYHIALPEEVAAIYHEIRFSNIFTTDKIALNPHFGPSVSGNLYALWLENEIAQDTAFPFVVDYQNTPIGFFVLKKINERTGDSMLAGLFNTQESRGSGFSTILFPMVEAKKRNMKKIITSVSSNNPDSLKVHLALGYKILKMSYILSRVIPDYS